jgi:hypothetical protein
VSFRAVWEIYPDGPGGRTSGDNVVVSTPEQVDHLVISLADPQAGTAKIWGPDIREDGWPGVMIHAAVENGYGYLSYTSDACSLMFSSGDSRSLEVISTDEEFPEGSGMPLPRFAAALREFLQTGERPRIVHWQPADAVAHAS